VQINEFKLFVWLLTRQSHTFIHVKSMKGLFHSPHNVHYGEYMKPLVFLPVNLQQSHVNRYIVHIRK
jgi:hypothetical protein